MKTALCSLKAHQTSSALQSLPKQSDIQPKRRRIAKLGNIKTAALLIASLLLLNITSAQQNAPSGPEQRGTLNQQNNLTQAQNGSSSVDEDSEELPPNVIVGEPPSNGENIIDQNLRDAQWAKYGDGKVSVSVTSIEPEGGPISGNTRVLVRGGPFKDLSIIYPHPKCKFGKHSLVVDATYVFCTTEPTPIESLEPRHRHKNDTCLQCDNSPETNEAEIIPFTVSLVGDFSDSQDSVPFRYYNPTKVFSIYPRYGPKDGNTFVQVWGANFLNFDENTRCNFGSKSVIAHYVNPGYITCISPFSDVVQKPIPFSISLNKQQNSIEAIDFWYYNWPQVVELVPNYGPDSGGNKVLVKGNNFMPFIGENIDNFNDTFCEFEGLAKVKAYPINSTKLICEAPPNYLFELTYVELTLNNQQYTDDNIPYYYYRPPQVFDIDPREGPTRGNTTVIVYGNKFKDSKNITCKFENKIVKGKFLDPNRIKCISPPRDMPGYVPLTISYEGERYSSETVKYLYYETPELFNITPTCGPVTGYTQVTLFGKNYIDMGFGKVKCAFNGTIFMNATILASNIIKCDSPPLPPNFGYSESGAAPFYYISVTLNGREFANTSIKFIYYIDPVIKSVAPNKGPLRGGTFSSLVGKGFNQEGVCNMTVRYGAIQQKVINFTDTQMNITAPPAQVPDAVVVSVALNGQQFIIDKTLHYRDIENTYIYYQDMFIIDYSPKAGPTYGNTLIKVKGMGFDQFKDENGKRTQEPIWIRFNDSVTGLPIADPSKAYDISDEQFSWRTPPALLDTKAIMEISYNKQDWEKVIPKNSTYSYQYYNAPQIISITPPYGPVKSPNNETIDIVGKNFQCPDSDCKDLYVRFGDPDNGIYVKGEKINDNTVRAAVPKYTKPDVLPVEITFNGQDYTHDNQTYGFFDPYVLDVKPRLIYYKGTTQVRLYGFGFVNATGTDLKTKFATAERGELQCSNKNCTMMATYIDKNTIETGTFPQQAVFYRDNGDNIKFDGLTVEASVYRDVYTENNIEVWYYSDIQYLSTDPSGSPANFELPVYIKTNFNWDKNDYQKFKQYANFTCRYSSLDGKRTFYTKARMETYPMGNLDESIKPTHVKCKSPKVKNPEQMKLDISLNGQEYFGDLPFTIYDALDLFRIVPLAGPNEGKTRVKMIGSGYTSTQEDVFFKWGILETEQCVKSTVIDYIWSQTDFVKYSMVEGSQILQAYQNEASTIDKYDVELTNGDKLKSHVGHAPKLFNWNRTHGGPIYLSVGQHRVFNTTNNTLNEEGGYNISYFNKTSYQYSSSFVEYYYYKQPVIKKVEPRSGLTRGGTLIEISGAWFAYRPEYGVVPHCKIGDKVSRALYFSTVRIVCVAPPNEDINQLFGLYVSLNGVDFVDSNYNFHYYEQPILYKMSPTHGPEAGGTQIFITGAKFSNISDPQNFKCRFTDLENPDVPAKYIPAFYQNQTTIMCSSPGGWGRGDAVNVQVTFNGVDYSDNNFTFYFYNIIRAFPRSGPANGKGGPILIEGSGFTKDTEIYCDLDKTLYEPLEIKNDVIKCPMVRAKQGEDFFGNVELAVVIDGNWHKFTGGFQYYEQPILDDIFPKIGPSEGRGIVNFYGKGFRDDYQLADVGCKIGDSIGKGHVISSNQIRCTIEEIGLVDEGYNLPATVALNSYSWTDSNQTFVPYGVTGVFPNSGPIQGNTDVLITGKGFTEDLQEKARCRFGVASNFAIVEAEILSYDKLICRSPPDFKIPETSDSTISVPIGVAFQEEEFEPFTESTHRYRFYAPPKLVSCDPDEVEVGKMEEVYVYADDLSEFWEPIPTSKQTLGQYGIECKFGRFGIGMGMYINKTTIKCMTPSVSDDPDSIWRESVRITVSLNGQDFDDDNSDVDFTFVGTGSTLVFWPYVIGTLLIGLLLVALIVFCSALLQKVSFEKVVESRQAASSVRGVKKRPYVIRDPYDQFTSRAYSSGMVGRQSAAAHQEY